MRASSFLRLLILPAVLLFGVSGDLGWLEAWGFLLLGAWARWKRARIAQVVTPHREVEESTRGVNSPLWDRVLMFAVHATTYLAFVVCALDHRLHGRATPLAVVLIGLVAYVVGQEVVAAARRANAFFSIYVRVQSERGHRVVTGGPYAVVRHPAYAGWVLRLLAGSLLLGSWWGLAASTLPALLLVLRTALEDRFLRRELHGYAEYAGRVRFRLLPGVF